MSTTTAAGGAPAPDLLIPELLRAHPEARAVFDRYGLHGCGGELGPHETIRFFARAHGVDEGRLLAELAQAIAAGPGGGPAAGPEPPGLADTIYRRYFVGGIVIALTAGASWGAWILWSIGLSGSFLRNSIQHINAHGEAQIAGWVGLFIMGFAYQAFPRMWHTRLVAPRLAAWVFAATVAGIALRTAGMVGTGAGGWAVPTALLGGLLQVAAVLAFAGQILATFRRGGAKVEPYVGFVVAALAWFAASSAASVWHTWATMTARTAAELTWYVATYQAPLRDLQIHGLALFMILGVSLRLLPGLYGLPQVEDRRAWRALGVLTAAVLGEVALFLAYRWTGRHALATALVVPWLALALGVGMVVLPWRLWRPLPEGDRTGKFVRAAYAWLAVSLAMLLLLPAYLAAAGLPFSHAYYGAIRHAITVGFISLMILGVAAKVVPTLNGVDPRTLPGLWGPFLLVNVGCFLRVTTQTLTDWWAAIYPVLGVSGTLEVAGIAWWGLGLIRLIRRGARAAGPVGLDPGPRPHRIESGHRVAQVLAWFPATEPVFLRLGGPGASPALLRTLGRHLTVAQAARLRGIDRDALLAALNAAIPGCPSDSGVQLVTIAERRP